MKRRVIVVLAALTSVGLLACSAVQQNVGPQPPAGEAPEGPVKRVMEADEVFRRAKLANDVAVLNEVLAEDYVGTNQNGNTRNKREFLDLWASFRVLRLTTDSYTVSFTEDGAIATVNGEMTEENATGVERIRFSRTYRRAPTGHWLLVRSMQTRR